MKPKVNQGTSLDTDILRIARGQQIIFAEDYKKKFKKHLDKSLGNLLINLQS